MYTLVLCFSLTVSFRRNGRQSGFLAQCPNERGGCSPQSAILSRHHLHSKIQIEGTSCCVVKSRGEVIGSERVDHQ